MNMPRKAPTNVVEQRVTFGTFERALLEPILKQQRNEMYAKSALYGVLGLAGIATVGSMAYFGIKAYGLAAGVAEELDQTWEDVKEKVNDVWSGPETVETAAPVPMEGTVAQDSGLADALNSILGDTRDPDDPTKRLNPAAGFPIPGVGFLFGLGMQAGEKSFSFTQKAARSKKNPLNYLP